MTQNASLKKGLWSWEELSLLPPKPAGVVVG